MCTTDVHEVRGGGVGRAGTTAAGPAATVFTVTACLCPAAAGAPAAAVPPELPGAAAPALPAELDSRALAADGVAAGCAVAEVSRIDAVTPAASTAAASRHTPPMASGAGTILGRRGQPGRRPPPVSLPGSPVIAGPPVACASPGIPTRSGSTQRSRAPRRIGSSMNRQDTAAAATVATTTAVARPRLTGPPAAPTAVVSTIIGKCHR